MSVRTRLAPIVFLPAAVGLPGTGARLAAKPRSMAGDMKYPTLNDRCLAGSEGGALSSLPGIVPGRENTIAIFEGSDRLAIRPRRRYRTKNMRMTFP